MLSFFDIFCCVERERVREKGAETRKENESVRVRQTSTGFIIEPVSSVAWLDSLPLLSPPVFTRVEVSNDSEVS